jgi:hypothetical protein
MRNKAAPPHAGKGRRRATISKPPGRKPKQSAASHGRRKGICKSGCGHRPVPGLGRRLRCAFRHRNGIRVIQSIRALTNVQSLTFNLPQHPTRGCIAAIFAVRRKRKLKLYVTASLPQNCASLSPNLHTKLLLRTREAVDPADQRSAAHQIAWRLKAPADP